MTPISLTGVTGVLKMAGQGHLPQQEQGVSRQGLCWLCWNLPISPSFKAERPDFYIFYMC